MVEQSAETIKKSDELAEYIGKVMPYIDARLEHSEVSLTERLLVAATIFVDEMVVKVGYGDTEEDKTNSTDYVTRPWFAIIYHHVENWYREHYGEALNVNEGGRAHGYVLVRSLPVELIVPLTRSRVETPGETAWLSFPKEVESDEDPLRWLGKSPNVAALGDDDRKALIKDVREVATALRSIRVNNMGIEPSDHKMYGLLNGIPGEFESAAQKAVRNETAGRPAALWNIHLAIERALKAFSQHKTGKFRETHNLFDLFDDVAAHGITARRNALKKFRRESDVIDNRYGLGDAPTVQEAFAAYKTGLTFVSSVVQSFQRKMSIGGASFLLGKPPWTSLPPTKKDGQG
jgi:HEPN domain-containing protein